MAKSTKNQIVIEFLDYYFKVPKKQYLKSEISHYKSLIEIGVLCENDLNNSVLEIDNSSIKLLDTVLEFAEIKTNKKLPLELSEAFAFIQEFEKILREDYKPQFYNSYDLITKKFSPYIISILYKKRVDVKEFLLSLDNENRESHLYSFERCFLDFLPTSNYSEKEIFEICGKLNNKYAEHDVITFFRNSFVQDSNFGNKLLKYAIKNSVEMRFISNLLIGAYNSGDLTAIDTTISLKEKSYSECLFVLGRLDFKNELDVEKAYNLIDNLELENIDIAHQQSYLISNIIENEYSTETILEKSFKCYADFLQNGTDEIKRSVFHDIRFIKGFEAEKYKLLHLYLSKTGDFGVIKDFFYNFANPAYVFDIMMRLFNTTPDYRFSTDMFENAIGHSWTTNQTETEKHILNLFRQHPKFGILGVMVILSAYFGIYQVDLVKLDEARHQINAINNICKYPHSFDKLLLLVLPLRNSKFKEVEEHLQKYLAYMVFSSYHDVIYKQIESSISRSKKDKEFLKPIKKALDDYHKLKELKESTNDLNPYENERDLMDLYYRLEHEEQAKMMKRVNAGKGTFMEMVKTNIIVRGNSFKFDDKEPTEMAKIESSMLIDGSSYLNPDLYEHNLNITE